MYPNRRIQKVNKLFSAGVTFGMVACLTISLLGQNGPKPKTSLPEDWSSQHVVFSAPRSPQAAAAAQNDPRYTHQQLRRNASASTNQGPKGKPGPPPTTAPSGDWSVTEGNV